MTTITRTNEQIELDGHASSTTCCAMITALSICLLANLTERLCVPVEYEIGAGHCCVNFSKIKEDQQAMNLIDAYYYGLQGLRDSYPENFKIIENI